MHFYMFNPADFNNSARHLSLVERAIYRDLIDMYYHSEQAIDTSDMDKLARRLLCTSEDYRASLEYVLDEFFVKRGKRHHHHRIDKEIKAYRYKNRNAVSNVSGNAVTFDVTQGVTLGNDGCNVTCNDDDTPMTAAERTRKSRQDRKLMIDSLTNIGVTVDKSIKAADLRELYATHAETIASNVTTDVTETVTHSNDDGNASNAKNDAITSNYEPVTNNHKPNINNNNSASDFSVIDSIADWIHPELTEINAMLMKGAPPVPAISQADYDHQLVKFKNYYAEKEIEGSYVRLEGRRKDILTEWIKRDYIRQQKIKAQSQPARFNIDNEDWSGTTKPPADDSYHPSHNKPKSQAKANPKTSVMVNGLWKDPLPGMSVQQTYDYIAQCQTPGEMQDEAYDRLLNQLQEAV